MKKCDVRPIKTFHTARVWIAGFAHPKILPHVTAYIFEVLKDFFLAQFLRKLKFTHIPILQVDHALDKKIPFSTAHIFDYLDFVNFWIRAFSALIKFLGIKKTAPILADFFMILKRTYKAASKIYTFRMTTTNRPMCKRTRFVIMRRLDPHYLCVPSLHISIVILTFAFFRNILRRKEFSNEVRALWTNELFDGAVKISEAVLYVKQHSVNCIPAALYMMTHIIPKLFFPCDAKNFLDKMFSNSKDIAPCAKDEIHSYMKNLFFKFYEEGKTEKDFSFPIKKWMMSKEFG